MNSTANAPALKPFRYNTRQRRAYIGNIAFASGGSASITIPQVGFVSRFFLNVNLQIKNSAAAPNMYGPGAASPWAAVRKIQLVTNLGTATLYDVDGLSSSVVTKSVSGFYGPNQSPSGFAGVDPFFNIPTATFVTNVPQQQNFSYILPVSVNSGDNFMLGLINAQAPELRMQLVVQWGVLGTDVAATPTDVNSLTITGGMDVFYEYFEVPEPTQVMFPPQIVNRYIIDIQRANNNGDFIYTIPRQGTVLRLFHSYLFDNAAVNQNYNDLTNFLLRFNKTDTVYNDKPIVQRMLGNTEYGANFLGPHRYLYDFYCANGNGTVPNWGDLRDAIDTEQFSTIELITTFANSPATAYYVRNIMQVLGT